METDIKARDDNKEVALGTSKINYMDPRISVAWCKRCEIPIDKVFAKTLKTSLTGLWLFHQIISSRMALYRLRGKLAITLYRKYS